MRLLLLTLFSLSCFFSLAQDFYPPLVNYSTHDYGKNRNPEIYQVAQDNQGIMYFATGSGVLIFDGIKWRFIRVGHGSFVRALNVDYRGVVYAGTYNEFGYFYPDSTGELQYNSLKERLPEEDQFFSNIEFIHSNSKSVFFQAQESVFEYEIEEDALWTLYPENTYHTSFLVGEDLYLREREVGVVKYENDELKALKGFDEFKLYGIFGMYELEDDSLLIVTQEIGLYKWKNGEKRLLPDPNTIPLTERGIFGSIRLADGNIALSTRTEGVIIINTDGKIVGKLDRSTGLRSNYILGMFQSPDQNLWLGMVNGVAKVNYHSPLTYYDEEMGIEGDVQSVLRFKDHLYVGTSNGLFFESQSDKDYNPFRNTNLLRGNIWDMIEAEGSLYVAAVDGVYRSSNGIDFQKVADQNANVIAYDPKSRRFFTGGKNGIFIYDYNFVERFASYNNYKTFLGAKIDPNYENTLWMGTSGDGIFRITWDENDEFVLDEYGESDGMVDNQQGVPLIFQDSIVFGTTQGLNKFINEDEVLIDLPDSLQDDPDFYRGIFQVKFFHDSIVVEDMFHIAEDENRTWYCLEWFLGYYDKKTKEFVDVPFLGVEYGRINEFYLEDNGILWVGAADGLIRIEQNDLKKYDIPFHSHIREVVVGRDSSIFKGTWIDENGFPTTVQPAGTEISIEYENNNVKFSFAGTYFEDGHPLYYSYQLEGLEDDWSPWSLKSEANFTNLLEGDYVFRVKAINIYNHESEVAAYRFTVLPPWYRTTWAYTLYGFLFLLILFIGVRISSARLKAKNAWLEGVVEERTKEIKHKNVVLQHQKQEIEDSINYAQRIQNAILPLETEMKKWVPRSFVLFRPKDIVSGDFYWFLEKDRKLVFVCADCTGHGVPGAFMSMIGSDRLNIIVAERRITSPGKILSELNRAIKSSLKQDGEEGSTRDGMDAAICTIDLDTGVLRYSGANRPLWIVENGEIQEIKATKVAVAGFTDDDQVFEEHEIPLKENLKFYMTSDGYADQFGGAREKKYKVKVMKEFILNHCSEPFDTQRDLLEEEIVKWMGPIEQVDDICVVGFETTFRE